MKHGKQGPENNWDELQALFDDSFKDIDRNIEDNTPSEQWFEQFAMEQQEILKRKYRKELIIFSMIAVLIISIILFALYESPVMFLVIQGAAFIAAVSYSGFSYFKQVKRT